MEFVLKNFDELKREVANGKAYVGTTKYNCIKNHMKAWSIKAARNCNCVGFKTCYYAKSNNLEEQEQLLLDIKPSCNKFYKASGDKESGYIYVLK